MSTRRLQPHAQPHRRQRRVGGVARVVAGRVDVGLPRALDGEAQRVADHAGRRVAVPAREPGQDRQPGRVGRRPAGRAERVRAEVPDRTRSGRPAAADALQGVELVQLAAVAVDDQRVAVAVAGVRLPLDGNLRRDRVRALVALVGVLERDARLRRRLAVDDDVGDADLRAVPEAGAEVGVDRAVADRGDQRRGVRGDGKAVDAFVPRVRRGEERTAAERRRADRRRRGAGEDQDGRGGGEQPHGCSSTTSQPPPRALYE